jgi:hypothetical protein
MIEITIYTLSDEIPNLPENVHKWTKLINGIQLNNNSNIRRLLDIGAQISDNYLINSLYWNVLTANIDEIDPFDINYLRKLCDDNNDLMINDLRIYRRHDHEAKIKYFENKYIIYSKPVNNDFEFYIPILNKSLFRNCTKNFNIEYNNLTNNNIVYKKYSNLGLYYVRILRIDQNTIDFINNVLKYYSETNADKEFYAKQSTYLDIFDMKIYVATREFLEELI